MCAYRKAILTIGMQLHAMSLRIIWSISISIRLINKCQSGIDFIVPRLFEEKRRDIVFGIPSFRPSVRPSVLPSFRPPNIVGTLCAQLLLQFYADSFETLQMF